MSPENSENPYMDHQLGHYFVNLGIAMMSTNRGFRWGWPVIYSIILHPLLSGIACMFRVIVLPESVTIWENSSNKRQQIPLQDSSIPQNY